MRHDVGHDSCVIVATRYSGGMSEAPSSLDKASLYPALAKVIQSHAALSVCLQSSPRSEDYSYCRLQTIDLDQVVVFSNDDNMDAAIQSQLLLPMNTKGTVPLWRLVILEDNTVVFSFHHCVGDGKSGSAFHIALLQALNKQRGSQEPSQHVEVPKLDLVPPVETVVDVSVSFGKLVYDVFSLLLPESWT